jgi:voltage-gated potassium channel
MVIVALVKRLVKGAAKTNIRILLLAALLLLIFGTVGSYLAETATNSEFQSGWDCLWWTLVTMSTVGYGDKVPITAAGRVIGAICMIGGPIIMVSVVGSIGISLYNKWRKGVRGMAQLKSKGHLVICGWNAKAKDIIDELRLSKGFRNCPITIIDDKIETKPIDEAKVSFVCGNASQVSVLKQANIGEAKFAVVLAEDSTPVADQKTVLTVLAIESINPSIVSCAELNDANNEEHLRRAGCDIVVNTSALTSKLLAMSLQNPAVNKVIGELVSGVGNEIYRVELPQRYVGRPFAQSLPELKSSHSVITIGVERDGECLINPPSDLILKATDLLLVISEEAPSL